MSQEVEVASIRDLVALAILVHLIKLLLLELGVLRMVVAFVAADSTILGERVDQVLQDEAASHGVVKISGGGVAIELRGGEASRNDQDHIGLDLTDTSGAVLNVIFDLRLEENTRLVDALDHLVEREEEGVDIRLSVSVAVPDRAEAGSDGFLASCAGENAKKVLEVGLRSHLGHC